MFGPAPNILSPRRWRRGGAAQNSNQYMNRRVDLKPLMRGLGENGRRCKFNKGHYGSSSVEETLAP